MYMTKSVTRLVYSDILGDLLASLVYVS